MTAALQIYCLKKVIEGEEKSLANEKYDASRRMYAAMMAIVGTTSEALAAALAGMANVGMRYSQGLIATASTVLLVFGRITGVIGGLGVAILDVRKAIEVAGEKQYGLAWLFVGSALAGSGLTITIALAATLPIGAVALPIIVVLLVALVVIGILIEYVKDSPLQDWLERCRGASLRVSGIQI